MREKWRSDLLQKYFMKYFVLQFWLLLAFRAGFFKSLMDRYMTDNVYNPYFTTVSQQGSDFELLFIKEGNFCQIEKPLLKLNEV